MKTQTFSAFYEFPSVAPDSTRNANVSKEKRGLVTPNILFNIIKSHRLIQIYVNL